MSFEPVHIHRTKGSTFENLALLAIPIILFVLALSIFVYKNKEQVAGVSTQATSIDNK